jgi:hypothetical protein
MISSVVTVSFKNYDCQEGSSLFACCRSRATNPAEKTKKKKSSLTALRADLQLTSKKKVLETIDMICDATPISREAIDDDERFFSYDKASDYPKGPSGFQTTQTCDQKRYYAKMTAQRGWHTERRA